MADEQNLDTQAFEANAAEAAGDDLVARVRSMMAGGTGLPRP